MADAPPTQPSRIRQYLLRTLPEADNARVEEEYFADDRVLDRVEAEEDQLVSDYVLGRLSESERRRFEECLLTAPYYRGRVETTSRLRLKISDDAGFRRAVAAARAGAGSGLFPGRTGSLVAIALLAILLVAALVSAIRLRSRLQEALREESPATRAATAVAGAANPGAGATGRAAEALPSTPEPPAPVLLERQGGEGPGIRRVERADGAPLLLALPATAVAPGARSFELTLVNESGGAAWRSGPLPAPPAASGRDVAVSLPAGLPPPGRYGLRLEPAAPGALLPAVLVIERPRSEPVATSGR